MQSKITTTQHDKPRTTRQVVQSYLFTTAVYDFNVYEKRIIYNLVRLAQSQLEGVKLSDSLYKIDHAYKDYLVVELPISDFLTDQDDKNHSRIKAALKSLHQGASQASSLQECFLAFRQASSQALPKLRLRIKLIRLEIY